MAHNDDVRFPINVAIRTPADIVINSCTFEPPMVGLEVWDGDQWVNCGRVPGILNATRNKIDPVCKCAYCGRYAPAADFECPRCGAPLPLGDNP